MNKAKPHSLQCATRPRRLTRAVSDILHTSFGTSGARAACVLSLGALLSMPGPAEAAVFTVTSDADSGPGTLREAIEMANLDVVEDDIEFSLVSGSTITLLSPLPYFYTPMNVNGPGAADLTIDGSGVTTQYAVLDSHTDLEVSGLTIVGESTSAGIYGDDLTVKDCTITGAGAGIEVSRNYAANVYISGSTISGNETGVDAFSLQGSRVQIDDSVISMNGVGVVNESLLVPAHMIINDSEINTNVIGVRNVAGPELAETTITRSTISGNDNTGFAGGGVDNYGYAGPASMKIFSSTISGNSADFGAGISNYAYNNGSYAPGSATVLMHNSTVSGNTATVEGGGIANIDAYGMATMDIHNSTITDNSAPAGAGVFNYEATGQTAQVSFTNTIVASQSSGADCDNKRGTLISNGYNLSSDATCGFIMAGDQENTDPMLEPLADNGGATQTHALPATSAAVDRIPSAVNGCGQDVDGIDNTVDQRGVGRPQDGVSNAADGCDVGAYELAADGVIGDFVWQDLDADGEQDPGEPGKEGVTVELTDCSSTVLFSTTTDADGMFAFTGLPSGQYQVKFIAPAGFGFSPQGTTSGGKDSNPDPATGLDICTSLPPGKVRLGRDAGLVADAPSAEIGNFVWQDTDKNGVQDPGEPGLDGVMINLLDCDDNLMMTTTSGANGFYGFQDLAAGNYRVEFIAPTGFELSPKEAGTRRGFDSNPSPDTGRTACIALSEGQVRPGIDAGMSEVPAATGSIGDYVWRDTNGDGVQDNSESGFNGVTVRLQSCAGGATLQTTATAGDGDYLFTGLAPGNYRVRFVAPNGFSFSPKGTTTGGKDSNANAAGRASCVSIAGGQSRLGIDAGLIED